MKNLKLVFGCLVLFLVGNISAQPLTPAAGEGEDTPISLPADGVVDFSVINISQENENAEISGANAGDTLRYEVIIKTISSSLIDFEPIVDISDILVATEIIDAGLGEVVGNNLVFPTFSQAAPCEKVFSFFVRVKEDCGQLETIISKFHNETTTVEISCDLPETGSGNQMVLLIAFILGVFVIFGIRRFRAN